MTHRHLLLTFHIKILTKRVTLKDAQRAIKNLVENQKQLGKDMVAISLLAHGGPNKTIMFSDGRQIRVAELLNVSVGANFSFYLFI